MIIRFLFLSGLLTTALPLCAELTYRGALEPPEGYDWRGGNLFSVEEDELPRLVARGNVLMIGVESLNTEAVSPTFSVYLRDERGRWSFDSIITGDPDLAKALRWSTGYPAVSEDTIVLYGEVFLREGDGWVRKDVLVPPQLGEDVYGSSVSIDGDVILIDGKHVFRRTDDRWIYEEERKGTVPGIPPIVRRFDYEGGGRRDIVEGRPVADKKVTGYPTSTGEVRLFEQVGSGWEEIALLTPPDPVPSTSVTLRIGNASSWRPRDIGGGQFGSSIALTEDTVFVFEGGNSYTPVVPTVHIFEGDRPEARWKTFLEGGEWVYDTMLGTYFERHHPWVYKEGTGWIYKGGDGYLYLQDQGSWSWAAGEGWIVELPTGEWQYLPMD